jgi:hypothetical protein
LIFYIKEWKPFCAETRNFDVKADQRSWIKFCVELGIIPVQIRNVLKLNECARTVSRTVIYPLHKNSRSSVIWEWKEDDGRLSVFTGEKKLTSGTFEALRKGARQTVKETAFRFDIGVETITKFKLQKEKICPWKMDGLTRKMRPLKCWIVLTRIIVTITDKVYVKLQRH